GVNFFRQIGASFGTALIGSLFVGRLTTDLSQRLPPAFAAKLGNHPAGVTPAQLRRFPPKIAHDFVVSYASALTPLYIYLVPLLGIGFVLVWFLKEKPLSAVLSRGPAAAKQDEAAAERSPALRVEPDEQATPVPPTAPTAGNGVGQRPSITDNGGEVEAARLRPAELSARVATVLNNMNARSEQRPTTNGRSGPRHGGEFEPHLPMTNGNGHNGQQMEITGSVYRADRTAAVAKLTLLDLAGRQLEGVSTEADGSYRLILPCPGTYLLVALPVDGDGQRPVAELVAAAGSTVVRDLELTST
ncbi:MAG: carboxypeptidase-like regulatory domain-containing protein, partial [Sciscionella sp.]